MPDLEYTVQGSSEMGFELPDAEMMAWLVKQAVMDWHYDTGIRSNSRTPYLDVEVTRISDDL